MIDGIVVRFHGREHEILLERLDAVMPIAERFWAKAGRGADDATAFGEGLFGAEGWAAIVDGAADFEELAELVRLTYIELADAAGVLPVGRA